MSYKKVLYSLKSSTVSVSSDGTTQFVQNNVTCLLLSNPFSFDYARFLQVLQFTQLRPAAL